MVCSTSQPLNRKAPRKAPKKAPKLEMAGSKAKKDGLFRFALDKYPTGGAGGVKPLAPAEATGVHGRICNHTQAVTIVSAVAISTAEALARRPTA